MGYVKSTESAPLTGRAPCERGSRLGTMAAASSA